MVIVKLLTQRFFGVSRWKFPRICIIENIGNKIFFHPLGFSILTTFKVFWASYNILHFYIFMQNHPIRYLKTKKWEKSFLQHLHEQSKSIINLWDGIFLEVQSAVAAFLAKAQSMSLPPSVTAVIVLILSRLM